MVSVKPGLAQLWQCRSGELF